jgi:hypothetical protein
MVEATPSLTQGQRQAQRQAQAVRVLAMHTAQREVKDAIRREARSSYAGCHSAKSSQWPRRE